MKKLLFLLLISPVFVHAQLAKSFEGTKPDIYKPIAGLILVLSDAASAFQNIDLTTGDYKINYKADNGNVVITMQHSKNAKTGVEVYAISSIKAPFSLLFPFWKQHFELDANMDATKAHEHGNAYGYKKPDNHEKVFSFGKDEKDEANWQIRIKEY